MEQPTPVAGTEGPYRSAANDAAPPPAGAATQPRRRALRATLALALVVGAGGAWLRAHRGPRPLTLDEVAPQLVSNGTVFPPPEPALDVAPSLDALLANDVPDALAVLEPGEGARALRRGGVYTVRFNRPMVPAPALGREVAPDAMPLRFEPAVPGVGRWSTRSTFEFTPAPTLWPRGLEARVSFAPELRSLAGETLADDTPRTLVLDTSPRLVRDELRTSVPVGSPFRLRFDGPIDLAALRTQLMTFELGGGARALGYELRPAPSDDPVERGVDLLLRRPLEQGARIGLALAPVLVGLEGEGPETLTLEYLPRPRVVGLACNAASAEPNACEVTGDRPGAVVDIAEHFTLAASEPLGSLDATALRVTPPLENLSLRVQGPRVTVRGEWVPGRVYELRFAGLRTAGGAPLLPSPPVAVRSRGLAPQVQVVSRALGTTGRVLTFEREATARVALAGVNVREGTLRAWGLDDATALTALRTFSLDAALAAPPQSAPLQAALPNARENRWDRAGGFTWLDANAGRAARAALLELDADGPAAGDRGLRAGPQTVLAQATDLGVHVRRLRDELALWVTSLREGSPRAGVALTVEGATGAPLGRVLTDADGFATLPLPAQLFAEGAELALYVRATLGDDAALVHFDGRTAITEQALSLPAPTLDAARSEGVVAQVFTDRGIYRPGETVRYKVVLRALRGASARAVRRGRFELRVHLPEGAGGERAPHVTRVLTNEFGSFDGAFALPPGAARGEVLVEVYDTAPTPRQLGTATARVQRYRAPTFTVNASGHDEPHALVEGAELTARVSARLLFGAPLRGAEVSWRLTRRAAALPARFASYRFGPLGATVPEATLAEGLGQLDAEGSLAVPLHARADVAQTATLAFEATVRDGLGEDRTAEFATRVVPAAVRVGLFEGDGEGAATLPLGAPLALRAVALDQSDEPFAGAPVTLWAELQSHGRYWQAQGDEAPVARRVTERREVFRCLVNSQEGTGEAACGFTPREAGTYVLHARTFDAAGHESVAERSVYVAGPDALGHRDAPGTPVTVTLTQRSREVGQQVEAVFECPFERAEALLLVERNGVLVQERRSVNRGAVRWTFPVTASMVPSATVSVVLAKPRTGPVEAQVDRHAPDLRVGAAQLLARPAAETLAVTIEGGDRTAPAGTAQEVTLRLADDAGRPVRGELAVYAVDEGTLRLTGYQPPNLSDGLFPPQGTLLRIEDLRRTLVRREEQAQVAAAFGDGGGYDEGAAEGNVRDDRERAEPTVLWLPRVRTDAAGVARVRLELPARPTAYRLMAVAVDAGHRSGRASALVTATQPLVVRALAPLRVLEGDRFDAAVLVRNAEPRARTVTVRAWVNGEERALGELALEANGAATVPLPLVVREGQARAGALALRVEARDGEASDRTETSVAVAARAHLASAQLVGGMAAGSRELTVELPAGTVPGSATLRLAVASHPFVGFDAALDALRTAPTDTNEALAAEALGCAAMSRLRGGLAGEGAGEGAGTAMTALRDRAERALRSLALRQFSSGELGAFGDDDGGDLYATVAALRAAAAARAQGWSVPAELVRRAREYLERATLTGDDRAEVLRALAESGSVDAARVAALYEARDGLGPRGLAQLALAMPAGDPRRDALALAAARRLESVSAGALRGLAWYDGGARALAAVLEVSARVEAGAGALRGLATRLLALREQAAGADWGSPHQTAGALWALASYAARFRGVAPPVARVYLDGAPLAPRVLSDDEALAVTLPEGVAQGRHTLRIEAPRAVFYALGGRWSEALGEADATPRSRYVSLYRVYETEQGRPLAEGEPVHVGDRLRVRLFVHGDEQAASWVRVRDRLPGGFEAIDAGLDGSPRGALDAMLGRSDDDGATDPRAFYALRSVDEVWRRGYDDGVVEHELRSVASGVQELTYAVRAARPGTFTAPPAELDARYDRSVRARSALATVTVLP